MQFKPLKVMIFEMLTRRVDPRLIATTLGIDIKVVEEAAKEFETRYIRYDDDYYDFG